MACQRLMGTSLCQGWNLLRDKQTVYFGPIYYSKGCLSWHTFANLQWRSSLWWAFFGASKCFPMEIQNPSKQYQRVEKAMRPTGDKPLLLQLLEGCDTFIYPVKEKNPGTMNFRFHIHTHFCQQPLHDIVNIGWLAEFCFQHLNIWFPGIGRINTWLIYVSVSSIHIWMSALETPIV